MKPIFNYPFNTSQKEFKQSNLNYDQSIPDLIQIRQQDYIDNQEVEDTKQIDNIHKRQKYIKLTLSTDSKESRGRVRKRKIQTGSRKGEQLLKDSSVIQMLKKKCEDYEQMIENFKQKIKELQTKITQFVQQNKKSKVQYMLKSGANISMASSIISTQKNLKKDISQTLQNHLKIIVHQFVNRIKNQKMTKNLQEKIQSFLQQILNINPLLPSLHYKNTYEKIQKTTQQLIDKFQKTFFKFQSPIIQKNNQMSENKNIQLKQSTQKSLNIKYYNIPVGYFSNRNIQSSKKSRQQSSSSRKRNKIFK